MNEKLFENIMTPNCCLCEHFGDFPISNHGVDPYFICQRLGHRIYFEDRSEAKDCELYSEE